METKHVPNCPVLSHDPLCPSPHALSDGVHHWWSGWPGAWCMGCGCDDPQEICVVTCEQWWENELTGLEE